MSDNPWDILANVSPLAKTEDWLESLLWRNRNTHYLRQFGQPNNLVSFRRQVPLARYEDLEPHVGRIVAGEVDVLFSGRPVAYERTGGNSGGSKLIPYSAEGLCDFQQCIVPWLAHTVRRHDISGRAYFSISPATRATEFIGTIPLGLSDTAYLGERAGRALYQATAVPFDVSSIENFVVWKEQTLAHLYAATDLELISVWNPTFLLRLLADCPDTQQLWPRLKVVSCWTSGTASRYVEAIRQLFPQATIEPKGLLATEAVVTVPDEQCNLALVSHGFFEFSRDGMVYLESELVIDFEYEVIVTTASGLYRYLTGDRVKYLGLNSEGRPILEFIGRDSLTSDLVGEKLTEAFVTQCLATIPGFAMLIPDVKNLRYVVVSKHNMDDKYLVELERRLAANSQYAYARKIGQLAPLISLKCSSPFSIFETTMLQRGVRLDDIKPTALRSEDFWLPLFAECRS